MSQRTLLDQYAETAEAWVDAEAAASLLEDCKSAVLAERMAIAMDNGAKSIAAAEQAVKATVEWREHVTSIVEARKLANRYKVQLEYLRMRFQEWQSHEANNRLEAKL
jgi:hypothetical protein